MRLTRIRFGRTIEAQSIRFATLTVSKAATVEPPLPRSEVPALLMRKDVLVNNMREGALDKVVY